MSLEIYTHPSSHPSVHPFICSSVHASVCPSVHPPTRPSIHLLIHPCVHLSIQLIEPVIHSFCKCLWSAEDGHSLLGRAFPGEGMSRCGLRLASLPAGALPMTGTDLPLESFPILGCLVLLGGRRPFPLSLGNCSRSPALESVTLPAPHSPRQRVRLSPQTTGAACSQQCGPLVCPAWLRTPPSPPF